MRLAACLVLVACGSPPATPAAPRPTMPSADDSTLRFRKLEVGTKRGHAVRTTFVLALGHDLGLGETEETLARPITLRDAERDPSWAVRAIHHYAGTRKDVADGFELALTSSDAQSLTLHCAATTVEVAGAGAVPVIAPEIADDAPCDGKSDWSPAAKQALKALACTAAGQATADVDDDDRLVFGAGPGLEWIDENDDCGPHLGGLRRAR